jgi:hypothetical protein
LILIGLGYEVNRAYPDVITAKRIIGSKVVDNAESKDVL